MSSRLLGRSVREILWSDKGPLHELGRIQKVRRDSEGCGLDQWKEGGGKERVEVRGRASPVSNDFWRGFGCCSVLRDLLSA